MPIDPAFTTFSLSDYGRRYTLPIPGARDGYAYRVDLYQRGYAGSVRTLRGGRRPARFRLGDRGSSAQFLAASSLEISVLEQYVSDLRQTISSDAWEWAMVLRRGTQGSEPTTIIWTGLVNAQTLTQKPREKTNEVSIRAFGGLGVLGLDGVTFNALADDPQGARRTIIDTMAAALRMISDRSEVRSLMQWYPWRDGSPMSGDPLRKLALLSDLWNGKRENPDPDVDVAVYSPYDALAAIAQAFGLEIFQSWDGWYAIQPQEAIGPNTVTRYQLSDAAVLGSGPLPSIDVSGWTIRKGSVAESEVPKTTVTTGHAFQENDTNLVVGGSFEDDEDTSLWTIASGAEIGPRSGSQTGFSLDGQFADDSSDDLRALNMPANHSQQNQYTYETYATQQIRAVSLEHPMEFRMRFNYAHAARYSRVAIRMERGDDFRLRIGGLQILSNVKKGSRSRIEVQWPFTQTIGIYDGRPVIPAGAELAVVRQKDIDDTTGVELVNRELTTITVKEPVRIGQTTIVAEVDQDIIPDIGSSSLPEPAFIEFGYFAQVPGGTPNDDALYNTVSREEGVQAECKVHCYAPVDGRAPGFDLEVGTYADGRDYDATAQETTVSVDNIRVEFLLRGEPIDGYSFAASAPKAGESASVPEVPFGDGPRRESVGALRFGNGTPTVQAAGFGWQSGEWSPGDAANNRTLAEHAGIETVRTLRDGIETETFDLYLPEGHDWSPAAMLLAPDPDGGTRYIWRRHIDWDIAAGVATITPRVAYKGPGSDIETAIAAESPSTRSSGGSGGGSVVFGGGGGGVAGVSSFNGRAGSVTLRDADIENALGYVPLPDGPFSIEDGGGGTLLSLDSDGNLAAAGDVVAFSSGSGGAGSGGGTAFQAGRSVELDTSTDPATLDVTLVAGTNVSLATDANGNYVISSSGGGGGDAPVDSVFGRTGVVEAESGDYSAGQITGFDVAAGQAGLQAVNTAFEITPDRIAYDIGQIATPSGGQIRMFATDDGTTAEWRILGRTSGFSTHAPIVSLYNGSGYTSLTVTPSDLEVNQNRVWHDANVQAADITGALGYTPIASGPFSIPDGSGGTLLALDADGNLEAAGDLIAFASGSGSGSGGGGTAFQAGRSVELDTGTDPATLDVTLVAGSNVSLSTDASGNYVISAAGGGGGAVDSVFGRTGIVTAQSGDYSAGQISGFDTAAVSAVELQGSLSVDIDGEAGSVAWSNVLARPALVNSFNGRSGTVSPQSGDYSASQISGFDTAVRGVSNLDADTLGGVSPSTYARLDQREEFTDGLAVTGGPFMVGTTTSSFAAEVRGDMRVQVNTNPASGGAIFSVLSSGGSERLRVEHDGQTSTSNSFFASGSITSGGEIEAFTSSDRRQKRKIVPIQNARSVLQALSPVGYYYNDRAPEHRQGRRAYGLLAQEVQRVIPEAVRRGPDEYLQLDYQQVIPYLVAAIREQQEQIDSLAKRG